MDEALERAFTYQMIIFSGGVCYKDLYKRGRLLEGRLFEKALFGGRLFAGGVYLIKFR